MPDTDCGEADAVDGDAVAGLPAAGEGRRSDSDALAPEAA